MKFELHKVLRFGFVIELCQFGFSKPFKCFEVDKENFKKL